MRFDDNLLHIKNERAREMKMEQLKNNRETHTEKCIHGYTELFGTSTNDYGSIITARFNRLFPSTLRHPVYIQLTCCIRIACSSPLDLIHSISNGQYHASSQIYIGIRVQLLAFYCTFAYFKAVSI